MMKAALKKILPASWLSAYHKILALTAATIYGHPAERMIVIGITGTKGKSTTGNILWHILTDAGHKVGLTGTVNYRIGEHNELSPYKMTMLGRFKLQKLLRRMVRAGCDMAIVETTSEGIKQWRHLGVAYDVVMFTNLTPEHIESHGGLENYKNAKIELFRHLQALPVKIINAARVPRASIVNMDSAFADDFVSVGNYQKVRVGTTAGANDLVIADIQESLDGTAFQVNGQLVHIPLLGQWNAMNTALAMGVGHVFGISIAKMAAAVRTLAPVPGRLEFINEGQPFQVIVDYAYEPTSAEKVYQFVTKFKPVGARVIALTGGTGGGRDKARWPVMGALAGKYADYVVVTDDDPYTEDRMTIINTVANGAVQVGKKDDESVWRVLDRRQGIAKAIMLARAGDIVLILGKGAEQRIAMGNKYLPWDDRVVVRQILRDLKEPKENKNDH